MSDKKILIEAKNLSLWRGENLLLDDVNMNVEEGSIVQICGTNGSGKTTFLRALIGLADYDEGEILWCGQPLTRVRDDLYEHLLYLGHKAGITGELTVLENLKALCPELLASTNGSQENVRQAVTELLSELGIADRIDLPCAALSAGQKRRVALARLRLQRAPLWVLDEPLTSLDAEGVAWVTSEIISHVAGGGAVLFTTHQTLSFGSVSVKTVQLVAA